LPPEWSKFVTDVKLVRDLHTTNHDRLHAYLKQHELHANEVCIMRECNQDPLALSPNYGLIPPTQHYSTTYPSTPLAISHSSTPYPNAYSSTVHQESCPQPPSVSQIEYTISIVNQQTHMAEFPQIDSGLAVPVFKQEDDPINPINKMMSFLSTGRQISYVAATSGTRANTSGTRRNYLGQQRVVKCFNYQREGHMARHYPKPKRKRDDTWFKEKVLLVEAQGNGRVLNEEELEFLVDPISTAKAVLMANVSCYGSDVLSEDTNSSARQDALILSVFEQLLNQVTNCNKVNNDNLIANETLSAELERYKEQEKNAQFVDFEKEVNNLKQTLSEQSKEKELLTKTFNVFKNKSKEKKLKKQIDSLEVYT
ncbi:hypothetical protein Tco_1494796, partial [Tanacetum coccineum]